MPRHGIAKRKRGGKSTSSTASSSTSKKQQSESKKQKNNADTSVASSTPSASIAVIATPTSNPLTIAIDQQQSNTSVVSLSLDENEEKSYATVHPLDEYSDLTLTMASDESVKFELHKHSSVMKSKYFQALLSGNPE